MKQRSNTKSAVAAYNTSIVSSVHKQKYRVMPQVSILVVQLILLQCYASAFTPIRSTTSFPLLQQYRHDSRTSESSLNAIPQSSDGSDQQLHLLTFDLDDTIFPIGPVVADANVAQLQTLIKFGYTHAKNEAIIAASKQIRTELREAGDAITYTDLRKQSIRREIERLTESHVSNRVHDSVIESVFDAWLSERHASADRNLFPFASQSLERIKEKHPDAVIAAITNGRGNPLDMPNIADYFDFCISGEDEGVFPKRKPDKGIYQAALNKYKQ